MYTAVSTMLFNDSLMQTLLYLAPGTGSLLFSVATMDALTLIHTASGTLAVIGIRPGPNPVGNRVNKWSL